MSSHSRFCESYSARVMERKPCASVDGGAAEPDDSDAFSDVSIEAGLAMLDCYVGLRCFKSALVFCIQVVCRSQLPSPLAGFVHGDFVETCLLRTKLCLFCFFCFSGLAVLV